MNLFMLYYANLDWCPWDKIEVTVGTEEKEEMTYKKEEMTFTQALKKYEDYKVMWFCKTEVWLKAKSEE